MPEVPETAMSPTNRSAARRKKQQKYKRHFKGRSGSPPRPGKESSETTNAAPIKRETPSVPPTSSNNTANRISPSKVAQRLSTLSKSEMVEEPPPPSKKKQVISSSPKRPVAVSPARPKKAANTDSSSSLSEDNPQSVPRRRPTPRRKADLVRRMAKKKSYLVTAATSAEAQYSSTSNQDADANDDGNDDDGQQQQLASQNQDEQESQESRNDHPYDTEPVEPSNEEDEDEEMVYDDPALEELQSEVSVNEEKMAAVVIAVATARASAESVKQLREAAAAASPDTEKNDEHADQLQKFVQESKNLNDVSFLHDDPSLVEMQSEVSAATSAFDMRSIHDHPPSPPRQEEEAEEEVDASWDVSKMVFENVAVNATDVDSQTTSKAKQLKKSIDDALIDVFEMDSWAVTNTDFSVLAKAHPDIDDFAKRLMEDQTNYSSPQEEEKKEKEFSKPDAAGWDARAAPAVFPNSSQEEQTVPKSSGITTNSGPDISDTSSREHADAAFSKMPLPELAHQEHQDQPQNHVVIEAEEVVDQMLEDGAGNDGGDNLTLEKLKIMEQSMQVPKPSAEIEAEVLAPVVARTKDSEKKVEVHNDDEPLLLCKVSSVDAAEDEYDGNKADDDSMTIEQRIEMYEAPKQPDEESSAEDDEPQAIPEDEEESADEAEIEVEYVDQVSDDDEEEEVERLVEDSRITQIDQETVSAENVPTFDVAAVAASQWSNTRAQVQVEGLNLADDTSSCESDNEDVTSQVSGSVNGSLASGLAGELFLESASVGESNGTGPNQRATPRLPPTGAPPPPPPVSDKKKRGRNRDQSGEKIKVPLIAPPPEEKLKQWEEGKMRAQRHIEALKTKRSVSDIKLDIVEPPVVNRESAAEIGPSLFNTPDKKKQSKSPGEKARSPTSGGSVLSDQKMAEKVALASSAAALTFEQRLVEGVASPRTPTTKGSPEAVHSPMILCSPEQFEDTATGSDIADGSMSPTDLVGGAFQSWNISDFQKQDSLPEKKETLPENEETVPEVNEIEITLDLTNSEDRKSRDPPGQKPSVPVIPSLRGVELVTWFSRNVLHENLVVSDSQKDLSIIARLLLEDETNFNALCEYIANSVNKVTAELGMGASHEDLTLATTEDTLDTMKTEEKIDTYVDRTRPWLKPMILSEGTRTLAPTLLAANFVSFLYLASKLAKVPSPFGDQNPFLDNLINLSLKGQDNKEKKETRGTTALQLIFDHAQGRVDGIMDFVYKICQACEYQMNGGSWLYTDEQIMKSPERLDSANVDPKASEGHATPSTENKSKKSSRLLIVPEGHPSPFEASAWSAPRIIAAILSFLGDPVAVCRMKMVNRFCCRIVSENEHMIMQDAVRVGGLSMNVRPAFWIWITLQKFPKPTRSGQDKKGVEESEFGGSDDLRELERRGKEGKWHHVIKRDVERAFGNMPPHKTGASLRTDSIVRALVTWGQNRIMTRGVKGGGFPLPTPELGPKESHKQKAKPRRSGVSSPPWECTGGDNDSVQSEASQSPTEKVSDWGGVSPVGSFAGSHTGFNDGEGSIAHIRSVRQSSDSESVLPMEELALSGNSLSLDTKIDLQNKLSFVLHSLAAAHEDVGYCQGMDYVVAHLLRILQDTVRWKAVQGNLPPAITTASTISDLSKFQEEAPQQVFDEIDKSLVVEEAVFRVMDTFFTTYNLRHMYWPELRCLKTCCRVFERLVQIKLPVLADHFEHHDLNVGLFALGWFQTLFLYLPSMPSATVCHMWDIWLVERSFKIFFRVGTAILFLSQPILLNHELEGMMIYLNTIPDATLLKPDILIACALNIKVTNKMLQELEAEVVAES